MTLSDKIQLLSIISSSILSIVSVTIAILTLKQTNKITKEANKANIVFFIDKSRTAADWTLIIKNFGKSSGKLLSLSLIPELSYAKSIFNSGPPLLTDCKNLYLAPNQSVSSVFPFNNYPDKKFDVTITYETLGEVYTEYYTLDLGFTETIYTTSPHIDKPIDALKNINESIREVADKLN